MVVESTETSSNITEDTEIGVVDIVSLHTHEKVDSATLGGQEVRQGVEGGENGGLYHSGA